MFALMTLIVLDLLGLVLTARALLERRIRPAPVLRLVGSPAQSSSGVGLLETAEEVRRAMGRAAAAEARTAQALAERRERVTDRGPVVRPPARHGHLLLHDGWAS